MIVNRGIGRPSRGREHMPIVNRAVVTIVNCESCSRDNRDGAIVAHARGAADEARNHNQSQTKKSIVHIPGMTFSGTIFNTNYC